MNTIEVGKIVNGIEINPLFKNLIPALTEDEFNQLEQNIIKEGVRDPLVVFAYGDERILIDGHNRFDICVKHGITDYEIKELHFDTFDLASEWVIKNQFGRRNINNYQRSELALKLKDIYRDMAKENQRGGQGGVLLPQNSAKASIETRKELAKIAGVSHDTISRVEKINEKASDEIKKQLNNGDMTINKAFSEIKKQERKEDIEKQKDDIRQGKIELPKGVFDILVVDPPWNYGREYDPDGSRVANPYPEMTQDELKELNIPASDNSIMWLWTTQAFIWDAKELLKHWGFEYKAILVWDKDKIGMGSWLRMQTEFCLLGIKGKPLWGVHNIRDIIREPRREHSRKPELFYQMIDENFVGNKLDYFSRSVRPGWEVMGNEINKFKNV